jgi:hypothetical protein
LAGCQNGVRIASKIFSLGRGEDAIAHRHQTSRRFFWELQAVTFLPFLIFLPTKNIPPPPRP